VFTETEMQLEPFQKLFAETQETPSEQLKKARKKAWDHFLELGLPDRKSDSFEYMHLQPLFKTSFSPAKNVEIKKEAFETAILPECKNSHIVFVNGYFKKELSDTSALPAAVVVSSLDQAMRTFGTFLTNAWAKALKEEVEIFTVLNSARHQEGIFIYIPPKMVMPTPIQFISVISTKEENAWIMPRINLFQGNHSELILANTLFFTGNNTYLYNLTTEITLEEGARLTLIQDALSKSTDCQDESSWIFDDLRVEMKRHANLKAYQLNDGKAIIRRDSKVQLAGEGSEAHLNGIWLLDGKKESHTHVIVDHQEPNTQSFQLFKGVITDAAHSSFQGKILVRKKAQKTQAYQLNNNLVLSDKAAAKSKPNLEIFADDVKASHGATVGQLDPDELFYLKTRGLSERDAKGMLIQGFCQEVIDAIPLASLREKAIARIVQYYKQCE
jgi:Fe-S cluster assembly protein SufD